MAEILDRKDKLSEARLRLVQVLIIIGFAGLVVGLWQIQILHGRRYAALAQANRIRTVPIPAPRGRMYDHEGRLLVGNYPSFTAYLSRDVRPPWRQDLPAIAQGLFVPLASLEAAAQHFQSAPSYEPIPIKQDITIADQDFIAAHHDQFPELETVMSSRRLYPENGYAANVIGYVGEPTPAQVRRLNLRPGAVVGQSGLEAYYNDLLMGRDGERRVVVNSRGQVMGTLSNRPPIAGHDLHLTLDETVQTAAEQALGNRPGAVVALDPRTGAVLALVSRPTFDPNQFVGGVSPQQWQSWATNPEHPLMDKAIQAQLAPGSVFKLVMSVAGLQSGVAENLKVDCTGVYYYHGHPYRCWIYATTHHGHGVLDITQAITHSCDFYFYTLGNMLGIQTIDQYARELGLGQRTGIDLSGEEPGVIPSPAWQMARFHRPWYGGETINVSIGQGSVQVTPIQLARLVGGIAGGGNFPRPHLNADAKNTAGFRVPLSPGTVASIDAGMRGVLGPGGTAPSAHLVGVDFGGKTGTAQTISDAALRKLTGSTSRFTPNAWFVGVSPVGNPQIAVCVLFQRGSEGSYAGRIAARVVQAYWQAEAQESVSAGSQAIAAAAVPPKPKPMEQPRPTEPSKQ
ncbi:MAG: penicillin-binding protein 2 [Terriglobales bacterium]